MSTRARLYRLPGQRHLVVASGLSAVALAMLIVAQAELLARILATAVLAHPGPAALVAPLAALAGVFVLRAGLSWVRQASIARAAGEIKHKLRRRLLLHIQALGPVRLDQTRGGELATLAGSGLDGLDAYLIDYLPQVALAVVVPAAVLIRVSLADWLSALIIVATLPLIPIFGVLVGYHTRAAAGHQWRELARLGGHFLDVIRGLPTLRTFGRGRHQISVVRRLAEDYRAATMRALRISFLSALVLEWVGALSVALVAVPVGLRLLGGTLGLGTGLLVLFLAPECYRPLRMLGSTFHAAAAGRAAAEQVFAVIDTAPIGDGAVTSARQASRGIRREIVPIIELRDVTVSYPSTGEPALSGVSLTVAPGERIALVGPSGAGKSSLLALLLGFFPAQAGTVTLAGADLGELLSDPARLAAWRQRVAWVPQRPHLFAATITENIALGAPGLPAEQVAAAARAAGAEEFIKQLPAGYGTILGEGGAGLSAGERQRIALARAFCRDTPVLLLDEPTAALDATSEAAVVTAARRLMAGRTVLLATHRHALLGYVDRILTVHGGRVVEVTPGRPHEIVRAIA